MNQNICSFIISVKSLMNENWKLRLCTLSARETTLSKCVFLCAKCQIEFRRHVARKGGGQCEWVYWSFTSHLCTLRNALLSTNFRIWHLGLWLSSMTSQRRNCHEKTTIFGKIWSSLILILCGKIVCMCLLVFYVTCNDISVIYVTAQTP